MSEEKKLIYAKIPKIMSLVGVVKKDKKNSQQGYNFRGIDDMYNALNEHMAKEGVFATSKVVEQKREERATRNGGTLIYTILTMDFEFFAEDGSSVISTTVGEAMDSGDKSMNKAMSTAYKYALMQIFCIPTEEEKDTEYQTHEPAPKSQTAHPPRKDATPTPATDQQKKMFFAITSELGWDAEKTKEYFKEQLKVASFNDITVEQMKKVLDALLKKQAQKKPEEKQPEQEQQEEIVVHDDATF